MHGIIGVAIESRENNHRSSHRDSEKPLWGSWGCYNFYIEKYENTKNELGSIRIIYIYI